MRSPASVLVTETDAYIYFIDVMMVMRRIRLFVLHCLLASALGPICYGQDQEFSYNKWVSVLSKRLDPNSGTYAGLVQELNALPPVSICSVIGELEAKGRWRNKWFRMNMSRLKGDLYLAGQQCPHPWSREEMYQEALRTAYEIEDSVMMAVFHQVLMEEYNISGNYGLGVMHGWFAKEIQERTGLSHYRGLAMSRFALGHALYHARDYRTSKEIIQQAVHGFSWPEGLLADTLSAYYRMNGLNTIGLCFQQMHLFDSAQIAFNQALELAKAEKNDFWIGLIRGNIGEVFYETGKLDTARALIMQDYEASYASGDSINAANALQWLARIDAARGNGAEGLKKLRKASAFLLAKSDNVTKEHLYEAYTYVFKAVGNADSLFANMRRFQKLHDSLELVAANYRAEVVQLRVANQSAFHKILILNRKKERITLIRNFTVGAVLLLAGLAYVDFKRQKLKIQLQKQVAQERQQQAEMEAANAREKLEEFTQHILDKSELIESLQQQLQHKEITAEQHLMIVELSHQPLLTDTDWDKFRMLFERVYPGFFISIKERAADITSAELRMAALIRLQVSTKESAALLGVSLDSIHKTRQRLKQRLQLPQEADLDHVIISL